MSLSGLSVIVAAFLSSCLVRDALMRAVKIIAGIVAGLLGVVLLVVLALLFLVDPDLYKPEIASVVKDKTGAELSIRGDIRWQFYPRLGFHLGETRLAQPGEPVALAELKNFDIRIAFWPLLQKRVAIEGIVVDGAQANLIRHADGRSNWDAVLAKLKSPEEEKSEAIDLRIDTVKVRGAGVSLVDESNKSAQKLHDVSVDAENIDLNGEFPLHLSFAADVVQQGKTLQSTHALDVMIRLQQEKQQIHLNGLALASDLKGSLLPGPVSLKLSVATLDADNAAQQYQLKTLKLDSTAQLPALQKPLAVQLSLADLHADLKTQKLAINGIVLKTTAQPKGMTQPVSAAFSTALDMDMAAALIRLPAFALDTLGLNLKGNLAITLPAANAAPGSLPLLQGRLASNTFSPRQLAGKLGVNLPTTMDKGVLAKASVSADIQGDGRGLALPNLLLKLDDSTVKGRVAITDLQSQSLAFDLALDTFNADRYLPPVTTKTAAPVASKPSTGDEPLLPLETLRALNLNGKFTAGLLTVVGNPVQNLVVDINAFNGDVNLKKLEGKLLNGSVKTAVHINAQGSTPVIAVNADIQNLGVGPVLQKTMGKDLFTGNLSTHIAVDTRGNSMNALVPALTGTASLKLVDGTLRGVNFTQLIVDSLGKYKDLVGMLTDTATLADRQRDSEVADISTLAEFHDGKVSSKTIDADLRKARMQGGGELNLQTHDFDYALKVSLDESVMGKAMAKQAWPVRCKGNLAGSPASWCGTDGKAMKEMLIGSKLDEQKAKLQAELEAKKAAAKAELEARIEQEKQQARDKAKQKLQDELKKRLKLF